MRIVSLVAFTVLASACAGTGHIDVGVAASSLSAGGTATTTSGTTSDAPRLLVTIERVAVHVGGADDEGEDHDAGAETDAESKTAGKTEGSGWVTVFTGPLEVDLRQAASAAVLLGDGVDVSPGKVTQIRLVLAGDAALVTGGQRETVACPSCTTSGLKIVPKGNLMVAEGERLHLDIVFDALASVTRELEGLRLDPVVKVEVASSSKGK